MTGGASTLADTTRLGVPLRVFAVVLVAFSALELAVSALLELLPMLVSKELRAEGMRGEFAIGAMMYGTVWLTRLVTLAAGVGLLRNRGWARAWIVCFSCASVIPLAFRLAGGGPVPEYWRFAWEHRDEPFTAFMFGRSFASFVLAVVGLVLLGFERWRRQPPPILRRDWAFAIIAVVGLFGVTRALGHDVRRAFEQRRVAATSVEEGTGTAVVTLLYGGAPVGEPDGIPVHVTLQDMKTNQQMRVSARLDRGTVRLPDLKTSIYAVGVVLDANSRNGLRRERPMAGDYEGSDGRVSLLKNGEVAAGEVRMFRMLRLLRPQDTEMGLDAIDDCVRVSTPVEFEWEAVPLATGYRCFVTRRWREGQRWKSDYAKSSFGPRTTCRLDLARNVPGEIYNIDIEAVGDAGRLTRFEDPRRGWASPYCFVVE